MPAAGGPVTLAVYDVRGRRVRTLVDAPQTPGPKTLVWNGRDDAGRPVTSGVYFSVLRTVAGRDVRKMVLLR